MNERIIDLAARGEGRGWATSWYEASARARIDGLLDAGSFREVIGPEQRRMSPHLPLFDLPRAFDDGMIVGSGRLDGSAVLVAAQEGRFMGGAFGEIHGAKLVGLLRAALKLKPAAVLILFDTGGVRLQEANAGETAIAEVMRAITRVRAAGVPVIGLIGGRAGAYGGGGLIAGTCSRLVVSEGGRISVSGPEVIETNEGAEEFDSRDRALVWRTMGGKHRRLTGGADAYADDTIEAFRQAALDQIGRAPAFDLDTLEAEQRRLEERIVRFGDCRDATEIWGQLGVNDPESVPALTTADFETLLVSLGETTHDAR
ncbi:biotin-independent malonate decarboxylase subunit beta [Methylorubrum rhodesianum]|uniref:biotin-independent malonate decarboxylase subunit beta n=1 Tax=Methylorubrum rhodesianum TaxID=29427 RepID=UPI003D03A034